MAMAYAQLSQAVSLLIATFCYICRQVLRVFARRDADRNTGDNFKQQVVTARYLTALLDQGIAIQHKGPLEEADDQCLGELATLVIKAKVSCAPGCPAPAEASMGALAVGCCS